MAPNKKGGEKKKGRSAINEVVTREYTVNIHKRIHGVWVHLTGAMTTTPLLLSYESGFSALGFHEVLYVYFHLQDVFAAVIAVLSWIVNLLGCSTKQVVLTVVGGLLLKCK